MAGHLMSIHRTWACSPILKKKKEKNILRQLDGNYLYTLQGLSYYEDIQNKTLDLSSVPSSCSEMMTGLPDELDLKVTDYSACNCLQFRQIGSQSRENKVHQQSDNCLQL